MRTTYDEILETMKTTFYEKCGKNFDNLSDVGLRMEAIASELYSLSCYGDYILNQAFPQSATGSYLDKHATLRNTARKKATKAKVMLSFEIPEPATEEIRVPYGTICACQDKPYIQFATDRSGYLKVGETTVEVEAIALGYGESYNVAKETISIMVNPPTGVSSVINKKSAYGGCDDESDEMLRTRLVNSYKVPASGFTLRSMANVVEQLDDVLECRILKNENTLDVYVKTPNSTISESLSQSIMNTFGCAEMLGFGINIISVSPVLISLTARCSLNSKRSDNINDKIYSIVKEVISANGIGQALDFEELAHRCLKLEEVEQISFECENGENGVIVIGNDEYLRLENFEVIINE